MVSWCIYTHQCKFLNYEVEGLWACLHGSDSSVSILGRLADWSVPRLNHRNLLCEINRLNIPQAERGKTMSPAQGDCYFGVCLQCRLYIQSTDVGKYRYLYKVATRTQEKILVLKGVERRRTSGDDFFSFILTKFFGIFWNFADVKSDSCLDLHLL